MGSSAAQVLFSITQYDTASYNVVEFSEKSVVEGRPEGKFGPYLALGRKMPGSWVRWILLSTSVLQPSLCEEIGRSVREGREDKFHVHTNQYVLVSKFKGETYVGYYRMNEKG